MSDSGVELIVADTINCGAERKLRWCDTNSTASLAMSARKHDRRAG
jgi:hypothetical protein